jgi:thioredoxin-dependent peroxiredoxin
MTRFTRVRTCLLAVIVLLSPFVRADVVEVHYFVRVGDKAPEFSATDDQGKKWKSTSHVGKKVLILFFYEGDFMTNCTKQVRDMQSVAKALRAEGAEAVGISGDSPANHQLFKKTNKLTLTLLCDEDRNAALRFGVSRSGGGVLRIKIQGEEVEIRRGSTPGRWTFIIDRNGKVVSKKIGVNPATHAKEVLAFVRRLNAKGARQAGAPRRGVFLSPGSSPFADTPPDRSTRARRRIDPR